MERKILQVTSSAGVDGMQHDWSIRRVYSCNGKYSQKNRLGCWKAGLRSLDLTQYARVAVGDFWWGAVL